MIKNSELRTQALQSLDNKWGHAILTILVDIAISLTLVGIINYVVEISIGIALSEFISEALSSIDPILYLTLTSNINSNMSNLICLPIALPLGWGLTVLFLDSVRGGKIEIVKLFDGFKDYGRILGTTLLVYVYTILWTLLFIIPGIIKAYSYGMTSYLLKDDSEIRFNGAIDKSREMMSGNKMKLFLMDLGFFGLTILSVFTLFIGLLWLMPYWFSARAAFYEDLKREASIAEQA